MALVEVFFKPALPEEVAERINRLKRERGITKTHMAAKAIEMYLDVMEGKAKHVPTDESGQTDERSAS